MLVAIFPPLPWRRQEEGWPLGEGVGVSALLLLGWPRKENLDLPPGPWRPPLLAFCSLPQRESIWEGLVCIFHPVIFFLCSERPLPSGSWLLHLEPKGQGSKPRRLPATSSGLGDKSRFPVVMHPTYLPSQNLPVSGNPLCPMSFSLSKAPVVWRPPLKATIPL